MGCVCKAILVVQFEIDSLGSLIYCTGSIRDQYRIRRKAFTMIKYVVKTKQDTQPPSTTMVIHGLSENL